MILTTVCSSPDASIVLAYSASSGIINWQREGHSSRLHIIGHLLPRGDKDDDELVFLNFINSHHVLYVTGQAAVVIDVSNLNSSRYENAPYNSGDSKFVIRRIALPCRCVCMDILDSGFVITGDDGNVYRIDDNGRVLSSFRPCESGHIRSIKVVNENCYIIGTNSELLLVNPFSNPHITSSYKLPTGSFVESVSIDSRKNWFCAVLASQSHTSRLVVGSTKCLATVFESQEPLFVSQCSFAETSSNGLCVIASGATPQLLLLPLDLSSAIPRIQFDPTEDVCAVLTTHSTPKGDLIVMAGVGPSVLLISAQSLSIVHRFTLD